MTKLTMAGLASAFTEFLTKHAAEVEATGSALNAVVSALPIQRQDRDAILRSLDVLTRAPQNILDWVKNAPEADTAAHTVKISEHDIDAAIARYFASDAFGDRLAEIVRANVIGNVSVAGTGTPDNADGATGNASVPDADGNVTDGNRGDTSGTTTTTGKPKLGAAR